MEPRKREPRRSPPVTPRGTKRQKTASTSVQNVISPTFPPPVFPRGKGSAVTTEELTHFLSHVYNQASHKQQLVQQRGAKLEKSSMMTPPDCITSDPKFKVSFALHLFQSGFSINDDSSCFQRYTPENLLFLNDIDRGHIPCFFSELAPKLQCKYYKGCLVIELHDYRKMTSSVTRPEIRRVLLKPHTETYISAARVIAQQRHLSPEDEVTPKLHSYLIFTPIIC